MQVENIRKSEIVARLIEAIAELLDIDEEDIHEEMSLAEEIGVDSLEMQDLFLMISNEYDIRFNLSKIINDIAVVLEFEKDSEPEQIFVKIEKCTGISFTKDNKDDFVKRVKEQNVGLLIKTILGYITISILADTIINYLSGLWERR